jgi:hypothetical protein
VDAGLLQICCKPFFVDLIQGEKMNLVKTFRDQINTRVNLKAVIFNIGWQSFDKFFRMGIGIIVSVWVARIIWTRQSFINKWTLFFVKLNYLSK